MVLLFFFLKQANILWPTYIWLLKKTSADIVDFLRDYLTINRPLQTGLLPGLCFIDFLQSCFKWLLETSPLNIPKFCKVTKGNSDNKKMFLH